MPDSLRFGIIGCGKIARKFANCINHVEAAQLVAVASATPGKGEAFAKDIGVEAGYSDYAQLVNRGDVDAVYVATTHNFHYDNVTLALDHGKHVLCEKPITVAAWEAEELIAMAR